MLEYPLSEGNRPEVALEQCSTYMGSFVKMKMRTFFFWVRLRANYFKLTVRGHDHIQMHNVLLLAHNQQSRAGSSSAWVCIQRWKQCIPVFQMKISHSHTVTILVKRFVWEMDQRQDLLVDQCPVKVYTDTNIVFSHISAQPQSILSQSALNLSLQVLHPFSIEFCTYHPQVEERSVNTTHSIPIPLMSPKQFLDCSQQTLRNHRACSSSICSYSMEKENSVRSNLPQLEESPLSWQSSSPSCSPISSRGMPFSRACSSRMRKGWWSQANREGSDPQGVSSSQSAVSPGEKGGRVEMESTVILRVRTFSSGSTGYRSLAEALRLGLGLQEDAGRKLWIISKGLELKDEAESGCMRLRKQFQCGRSEHKSFLEN